MYSLNWMDYYYGGGYGGLIAGVVVALVGTVLAAVYFFGPDKRSRFSGYALKLYSHVNFDRYIIPVILKFLYVFTALFLMVNGLITLFSSFFPGLLMFVLGPLAARIAYELIMMLFSIHDGIEETNRLLRGGAQQRPSAPQQYAKPMHAPQPEVKGGQEEVPPEQPKHYPGGYDPMHRG
jgi:hypothetical protein